MTDLVKSCHLLVATFGWMLFISTNASNITICLPGEIHYNSSLKGEVNAGVFTIVLDNALDMETCINAACQKRKGDMVFMIESKCFFVSCFRPELCDIVPAPVDEEVQYLRSVVATYRWIDPAPIFTQTPVRVAVAENGGVRDEVTKIQAKSESRYSKRALMKFIITAGNTDNAFQLEPNISKKRVSLLTTRPLDREKLQVYNLTITVLNMEERNANTSMNIDVVVTDTNDEPPVFSDEEYHVNIYRNFTIGSLVTIVTASDMDNGSNADIKYTFTNNEKMFSLEENTGAVTLKSMPEYEDMNVYEIPMQASDGIHTAQTKLVVHEIPVNRHPPVFKRLSYSFEIGDTLALDTPIIQLQASDPDKGPGGEINFYIVSGDENGNFDVNKDGFLGVVKNFEYGKYSLILKIGAHDYGVPQLYSVEYVTVVVDVDIQLRRFLMFDQEVYDLEVPENVQLRHPVVTVQATKRTITNKRGLREPGVEYTFNQPVSADIQDMFSLSKQDGLITNKKMLDFEKGKFYRFNVTAKVKAVVITEDEEATAIVIIRILDVNDNNPQFEKSKVLAGISTKYSSGFTLPEWCKATDKDSGKNKELVYSLKGGNGDGYFNINAKNGFISTTTRFSKEAGRTFALTVDAQDKGTPPLKAATTCQVTAYVEIKGVNMPVEIIDSDASTITVKFKFDNIYSENVRAYSIIIQEYMEPSPEYSKVSLQPPVTWSQRAYSKSDQFGMRRYVARILQAHELIQAGSAKFYIFKAGDEGKCNGKAKEDVCNGVLKPGGRFRFQVRFLLKRNWGWSQLTYLDSDFSRHYETVTQPGSANLLGQKKDDNYDTIVIIVGTALVLMIVLAFVRGFVKLRNDRKRLHEERKNTISFPVSNPNYHNANSPEENTPLTPTEERHPPPPAFDDHRRNQGTLLHEDKCSDIFSGHDEDDAGSTPDSALGTYNSWQSQTTIKPAYFSFAY